VSVSRGVTEQFTAVRAERSQNGLRLLIRRRLADGHLPEVDPAHVWGGRGNGEICDACEETITKDEFAMEGAPQMRVL
jgi:hypothetical protein